MNGKQAYFVTGTDTGVGKTLVSSALVHHFAGHGLRSVGMKPVAAGCVLRDGRLMSEDVEQLVAASNVEAPLDLVNPYALAPAIAPHIAATQTGAALEAGVMLAAYARLLEMADAVIVEGVGGFCVPLDERRDTADLAQALMLPVILVVGMRLGCLNHALLTAEAVRSRGLRLAGWVANRIDPGMPVYEENLQTLRQRLAAPCLGVLPWLGQGATAAAAATHLQLPV
jgi:dethiobiotin synthetase